MKKVLAIISILSIIFLVGCVSSFSWSYFEESYGNAGYVCQEKYDDKDMCLEISEKIEDRIHLVFSETVDLEVIKFEKYVKDINRIIYAIEFEDKSQAKLVGDYDKASEPNEWLMCRYGKVLLLTNDIITSRIIDLNFE